MKRLEEAGVYFAEAASSSAKTPVKDPSSDLEGGEKVHR